MYLWYSTTIKCLGFPLYASRQGKVRNEDASPRTRNIYNKMFQRASSKDSAAGLRQIVAGLYAKCPIETPSVGRATINSANDTYLMSLQRREDASQSGGPRLLEPILSHLFELGSTVSDRGGDRRRIRRVRRQHCGMEHRQRKPRAPAASKKVPSVSAGIHGSTEYGKLSMSAHRPRMAECSDRSDSAYAGSRRPGKVILRAKARNRFCEMEHVH